MNTELVKIEPYTPPIVTPPVPVVVMYECKIDKLNIRHEPTSNSDDIGGIRRGQRVGVVAVIMPNGNEEWAQLETGGYAAIKIGANVYLEKVETGG